ncbi:hypothetical protein Tco_0980740 [Tanacetum coccineum]
MVAYLQKSEGSEGFHQIIDFLNASHIQYALTENPTIYVSFIKQFWRTATAGTSANGEVELTATIDGQVKTITEASLRRHLKLEDNDRKPTQVFDVPKIYPNLVKQAKENPSTSYTNISYSYPYIEIPPSTSQPPNSQPTPDPEEAVPMPHESPLYSVHLLGRDEGSLSLNELTDLCTSLSKKGRSLIEELDMDAGISLVPLHAVDVGRNDDTQIYDLPAERRRSVSTGSGRVSTTSRTVSTAGCE